jgi:signal transduction histidine kinase
VAFRWRIRHKLMIGLGVVVGIMSLLLGGTLYGLAKFRATMKSIDSKHAELKAAESVRDAVQALKISAARNDGLNLLDEIEKTNKALDEYIAQLQDTVERGRDPDNGSNEKGVVDAMRQYLADLDAKSKELRGKGIANSAGDGSDPTVDVIQLLVQTSLDLCSNINDDLSKQSLNARETFKTTLWIVCTTSIGGVLFLCSLLRSFYAWMFYPIRDLEQGAGRVAQGDFEHRIEVHSGDEMEDLAAAFNDMTGRLREMYRDLARQVNDRSRQLVRSERLAGVGFLAAGVAHEINNPLASIAFCSEALEGRLADILARSPDHGEVISKYLRMIQQEAFRCKAITQRLLEFSRGGERRREPTDLAELVQGVLDMVQHLQNCKGKHIRFATSGRLIAWVNAQEIKSVVLNLVVNALDSMDDGGSLTITLRHKDYMAEIEFADTGCGMSPEILENIFEPFFTRSRTGKGTGLGLSISHRVISQHGGEIEATSAGLNQGSMFTVRLPLKPAEQNVEEPVSRLAA